MTKIAVLPLVVSITCRDRLNPPVNLVDMKDAEQAKVLKEDVFQSVLNVP